MTKRDTGFIDPALIRKSGIIDDSLQMTTDGFPLPSVVEISESGTCNRKCIFCPRSAPDFPDLPEFIKSDLLEKLARELAEFKYSGIFLFSGFVEPMLDKEIYNHISLVKKHLPGARIEMVTNGDALNLGRLIALFEAGLTTILISVYDSAEDAARFDLLCKEAGLRVEQFVIRHRYLPEEQSFGITMNNRSGMMGDAIYSIPPLKNSLKEACYYPLYTFFMDYLGDVLLCPHDWGKKKIIGNMYKQSFKDIWLSKSVMGCRSMLAAGNRKISPCNQCDAKGTLMGATHLSAWGNLEQ
jgi:radical SAM protein with 4Fe4S-binding SPASM domain